MSHYRFADGWAAHGIVYQAENTRLYRFVALKFWSEQVTRWFEVCAARQH